MPPERATVPLSSVPSILRPTAEPTENATYLFQDETSHARRYVVLALIGLAVAVMAWQVRDLHSLASRFLKSSDTGQSRVGKADTSVSTKELQLPQSRRIEGSELASKQGQLAIEETSPGDALQEGTATATGSSKAQVRSVSTSTTDRDQSEAEGEKYLYGGGVPADCERAQQNLLTAAEQSSAKAQSTLGTMYATGHCTIRDLPLAYRWFARAQHQNPRNRIIEKDMKVVWDQMSPEEKKLAKR